YNTVCSSAMNCICLRAQVSAIHWLCGLCSSIRERQGAQREVSYEDRRHRRKRTYRKKGREEPSSARPRGAGGITIIGCQHRHWRGTGASACRRSGGRRCRECTLLVGQGSSAAF